MDEQVRLLALAHLKNGNTPTEVSNMLDITYARALKLRKELLEAEENNAIQELFNMEDAAVEILLDSIRQGLEPVGAAFGLGELVEDEIEKISVGVHGLRKLDADLQESASAIAIKIKQTALSSNNADTILSLAEALCKLQISFFGVGAKSPTGNQTPGLPNLNDFEKLLRH